MTHDRDLGYYSHGVVRRWARGALAVSLRSAALVAALSVAAPMADARAILLDHNVYGPSAWGLVTLDTTTGIEWADLSIAAAPTLAEAIAKAEAAAGPGWSLATRGHLLGLVEPFLALPIYDGSPWVPRDDTRLLPIIFALGTNLFMDSRLYTHAIYAEGSGTAWASIAYEDGSRHSWFGLGFTSADISPNQYFLVRAIPEPTSAALVVLGLAGLAYRRSWSRQ